MAEPVLYVEIVPTTKGVKRSIEKELNGSFDTAEKKGTSLFSKLGGLAKGVAVAAGAAAVALTGIAIKGGFERMLKIEDATAKLDGLGHSAEAVDQIMGSALAAVKGTAYGLDTAATVAASAVAAGIKPGQELEKYLRLTADAATIAGISMDEMGSIMNKVQANGRAMTENLNQLQDRGIPILQWLATEYGVATDEMSKMVSQGEVDAATFNRVIEQNIGGAALRSGETTRGAWANMLAALSRVGVALLEDVFPYFKDTFNGITVLLDDLTDKIGPFSEAFAEKLKPIAGAIRGLFDLLVKGDFTSALTDAFGWQEDSAAVDFFLTLRDRILEIGPAIGDLAGYFTPLGAVFKLIGPLLPQLLDPLMQIGDVLGEFAVAYLPVAAQMFATLGESIGGVLVQVLPVVATLMGLLAQALDQALPVVVLIADVLGQVLAVALEALAPILDVVIALLDPLMAIFSTLIPIVLGVVQAVLPLVMLLANSLAPVLVTVAELVGTLLTPVLTVLNELFLALTPVIENSVKAGVEALGGALAFLIPVIEGVVNAIGAILVPIIEYLMNQMSAVIDFLVAVFTGNWEAAWAAIMQIGENFWNGFFDIAKGVINGVIDLLNGFLNGFNSMGSWLSDITGGTIGFEIGTIPQLEDGALVKARAGGTIANIGEGRYDEMVVPLSPQVLGLLNGGGNGTQVNVYPQPGMSEEAIGRAAAARLDYQLRRA